jgi:hypothetical protein
LQVRQMLSSLSWRDKYAVAEYYPMEVTFGSFLFMLAVNEW